MAPISTDQLENYLLVVVTPPWFQIHACRWVPGWRRYTPTLWVHGTAQSLPQSALQLTRMAPISTDQLENYLFVVVTPPVFQIRACRWVPGWRRYTPTLWVHGTAQSLPQSALQLTRMAPISTDQLENYLLVVVTPPVFQIRACRWVPGWRRYTPTLWVHGTAQSLPQSALQLTRMAPISTDQLENYLLVVVTPPVFQIRACRWVPGWRRYTPTLWEHGTVQSLPQSALQLTRMAPISTDQLENYLLVVVTPPVF